MNINNPMLNEIQKDYSDLFEIVDEAVSEVFPELTFPEDEIGFIVLHFAAALISAENFHLRTLVLCSSGIGTSKILATNLKKHFPEIIQKSPEKAQFHQSETQTQVKDPP